MFYNNKVKKTLIFGGLFLFLFAGFQPPDGMRKLPTTSIEFEVENTGGSVTATLTPSATFEEPSETEQEE
jgi:hypothetical protein